MKILLGLLLAVALSAQVTSIPDTGGGGGVVTPGGSDGDVQCNDGGSLGACLAGSGIAIAGGFILLDDGVVPTYTTAAGTPTMVGQKAGSIAVNTSSSPKRLNFCGHDTGTDCDEVIRVAAFSEVLPAAGGTLTGQLVTASSGIEFTESDSNPSCASGNFTIYADTSENKLKKCQNGSASDLDTTGGAASARSVWLPAGFRDTQATANRALWVTAGGGSVTISTTGTAPDTYAVLLLPDSTDNSMATFVNPPPSWSGTLDVIVYWMAANASTNSVRFQVATAGVGPGDSVAGSASYNTASETSAANGGSSVVNRTTFTGVAITNWADGEILWVKITRDGDGTSGTDDLAFSAQIIGAKLIFN